MINFQRTNIPVSPHLIFKTDNTMTIVEERNLNAHNYVKNKLDAVANYSPTSEERESFQKELKILEELIPVNVNGFRGVVLTAIVGMHLDTNYDPSSNFYNCNPRSIFEKGIYYALQNGGIPCGKSDPLNVAKNIQKLDKAWAYGKRPEAVALAAVSYLEKLVQNRNTAKYDKLITLFFWRLNEYGKFLGKQNITISNKLLNDIPLLMANKLGDFACECSEGGSNTQYVTGLLIKYIRDGNVYYKCVEGFDESVFGTNTTSKKPADVWEINSDGSYGNLYEITVKVIDKKRLDDCAESLRKLKLQDLIITFVCEMPENTATLGLKSNSHFHNGIAFQFLDIRHFIRYGYIQLNDRQRKEYLDEIQEYIFSVNRSLKTKDYWAENFG